MRMGLLYVVISVLSDFRDAVAASPGPNASDSADAVAARKNSALVMLLPVRIMRGSLLPVKSIYENFGCRSALLPGLQYAKHAFERGGAGKQYRSIRIHYPATSPSPTRQVRWSE
jgi:hypothetical protein